MKMNDEQVASLAGFALDILNEWPDVSLMDGGDLQEIAEKHKLLVPQIVHAPCSDEDCACAEVCSDEEFARGVTCYRIVDWLVRDAQLRIGADDAGHSEPCPPDRHMYYQWFLNYQYCPYCGERVHS
jgi:hypothetical protein